MATTTPDGIFSPDAGDAYALTTDLAALADTAQDAITAWKNYGIGTDAQRSALTSTSNPPLKDGLLFYTTDTKITYQYNAATSSWHKYNASSLSPYNSTTIGFTGIPIFKSGKASGVTNGTGVLAHTFPAAFPSQCSAVILMPHQNSGYYQDATPTLVEGTVSRNGFSSFWGGAPNTQVYLPYFAVGY